MRSVRLTPFQAPSPAVALALAATLALGAGCGTDAAVHGGPDVPVLDTGADAGLDVAFDVPLGDGGGDLGDAVIDATEDAQPDALVDATTDAVEDGTADVAEDAVTDAPEDGTVLDIGEDGGGDTGADATTDTGLDATTDTGLDATTDAVADTVTDAVADVVQEPDAPVLLELGETCELNEDCLSNRCESFGDQRVCTTTCEATCPVDGLECYDGLCTPADFCGEVGGLPYGPGCPCDALCDVNATCVAVDDVTEVCDCDPGYDGDGFTCALRDLPWLRVTPTEIDFGVVGLFESVFESVTIENVGPEPRVLSDVRLQQQPSQGFAVFVPFAFPLELAPETSTTVDVRFRPTIFTGGGGTPYTNTVLVDSDDPARPRQTVALSGTGVPNPERCLNFNETTVDFGVVAAGDVEATTVTLSNCGEVSLDIDVVELFGDDEGLSLAFGPDLPTTLAAGASFNVVVTYAPTSAAPVRAVLSARATDGTEAAAQILGGYTCPTAAIAVEGGRLSFGQQGRIVGRVGDTWTFDGGASDDPAGGDLSYQWTVVSPEGSTDLGIDPDLGSVAFSMSPDVTGRFVVELRVQSDESGLLSCNVARVLADSFPIHAEVSVQVSWNNQADVDLHLTQSDAEGNFTDFGTGQNLNRFDCYWANLFADFGVVNEPADNAWLLGDDIDGFGPEQIDLGALDPDHRYRVGVNYARRLSTESVTPTVSVTIGAETVATYTTTMTETNYWIPVIIEGDGTLTTP